jgi:hypothetical protein
MTVAMSDSRVGDVAMSDSRVGDVAMSDSRVGGVAMSDSRVGGNAYISSLPLFLQFSDWIVLMMWYLLFKK